MLCNPVALFADATTENEQINPKGKEEKEIKYLSYFKKGGYLI